MRLRSAAQLHALKYGAPDPDDDDADDEVRSLPLLWEVAALVPAESSSNSGGFHSDKCFRDRRAGSSSCSIIHAQVLWPRAGMLPVC